MPNQVIKTSPCGNVTVYELDNVKKLYARVKHKKGQASAYPFFKKLVTQA